MKTSNILMQSIMYPILVLLLFFATVSCGENPCTLEEFESQDGIHLNLDIENGMDETDSNQLNDDGTYPIDSFENQGNISITPNIEIETNEEDSFGLTDEDFVVKNGNDFIGLLELYEEKEINEDIIYSRYYTETKTRFYDTFKYENILILAAPNGGEIFFIELTTPVFETARGIRIGDSISDVFEKYGVIDGDTDREYPSYAYRYELKHLNFYVDEDGIVTIIRLGIT